MQRRCGTPSVPRPPSRHGGMRCFVRRCCLLLSLGGTSRGRGWRGSPNRSGQVREGPQEGRMIQIFLRCPPRRRNGAR
eukprot:3908242-Pyramimonas_sp.AAC.1